MGVLDRLTRRSDGARRFSLVAAPDPSTTPDPSTLDPSTLDPSTPAGVALMPLALRAGAVSALTGSERAATAVTEQLAAVHAPTAVSTTAVSTTEPDPGEILAALAAPAAPDEPTAPAVGYAVLDVVASGMSPEHDRLVEIAVVQLDADGAVVGEWTSLLRPSVLSITDAGPTDLVHLASTAGAGVDEIATAPTLADVAGEVVAALAGRVLVAHGAPADLAFLRAELAAVGVVLPPAPVLCTLEASWRHLPGLSRRRLADCCRAAGVALDGLPTALTDARAAAGLLQRYLARGGERGEAQSALVTRAAVVAWPEVPAPPMSSAAPRGESQPSLAAAPGRLAVVLEVLPLDGPQLPLPAVAGHVELLAAALAAGPLDDAAARSLALLADAANLTRAQVRAATRGVVLALAGAVGREPTAGEAEREELLQAARVLAVDHDDVVAALTAAAVATGSLPQVSAMTGMTVMPGLVTGATTATTAQPARVPTPRAEPRPPAASDVVELLDLSEPSARAAVRAWARENGVAVSARGKLPRSVVDAFAAARAAQRPAAPLPPALATAP